MKVVVVVALIVALAFDAARANTLTRKQSEKLTEIRNGCAARQGIGPYEIGTVIRAIRPIEQLIRAGQCVLRTLGEQASFNDDEVAADILYQLKLAFEGGVLPKTIGTLTALCREAVGSSYCQKAVNLAQLILELGNSNGIRI